MKDDLEFEKVMFIAQMAKDIFLEGGGKQVTSVEQIKLGVIGAVSISISILDETCRQLSIIKNQPVTKHETH